MFFQKSRSCLSTRKLSFPLVPNSQTGLTKGTCSCQPLTSLSCPRDWAKREEEWGICNEVGCFPLKRRKDYLISDNNLISDGGETLNDSTAVYSRISSAPYYPSSYWLSPLLSQQWKTMRRARVCSLFLLWEKVCISFFTFYFLDFSFYS